MKKIAIILCAFLISSVSLFTFNASAKNAVNTLENSPIFLSNILKLIILILMTNRKL